MMEIRNQQQRRHRKKSSEFAWHFKSKKQRAAHSKALQELSNWILYFQPLFSPSKCVFVCLPYVRCVYLPAHILCSDCDLICFGIPSASSSILYSYESILLSFSPYIFHSYSFFPLFSSFVSYFWSLYVSLFQHHFNSIRK